MFYQNIKVGCVLKSKYNFSCSVLKSNTGNNVPCIVFVLSMFIVRFSEKSIWECIVDELIISIVIGVSSLSLYDVFLESKIMDFQHWY